MFNFNCRHGSLIHIGEDRIGDSAGIDERGLEAGGRLYFAKESRAKGQLIPLMYPAN